VVAACETLTQPRNDAGAHDQASQQHLHHPVPLLYLPALQHACIDDEDHEALPAHGADNLWAHLANLHQKPGFLAGVCRQCRTPPSVHDERIPYIFFSEPRRVQSGNNRRPGELPSMLFDLQILA
jgi:hypothetical protein